MHKLLHHHSPFRIFAFSAISSLAILVAVGFGLGWAALGVTLILTIIEVTFSFDNAIINAKVLDKLSQFWQTIFLTVGIFVAIFGMRIIFPIAIVSITAGLSWGEVWNLALKNPTEYAHYLELAHPTIAAFGGAFLLMLALQFFFHDEHQVLWFAKIERQMQKITHWSGASLVSLAFLVVLSLLPANHNAAKTLIAGAMGIATFMLIQGLVGLLEKYQPKTGAAVGKQVGMTAVMTLLYLEILDASFSFDGVIGAFAITTNVVLIAAGLGIGALWVRSLTVFMVRRGTLNQYRFLEHGAHYTVFVLALILLIGLMVNISDFVPGIAGLGIIVASIVASVRAREHDTKAS